MALTFPSSPAKGDSHTDAGGSGQRYTWDGVKWIGNANGIRKVEPISQAAYAGLISKDPSVLYLVS